MDQTRCARRGMRTPMGKIKIVEPRRWRFSFLREWRQPIPFVNSACLASVICQASFGGARVPRPARFAAGRACRLVTSAWLHSTRSSQTELPASVCNLCVPVQVQATGGGGAIHSRSRTCAAWRCCIAHCCGRCPLWSAHVPRWRPKRGQRPAQLSLAVCVRRRQHPAVSSMSFVREMSCFSCFARAHPG